MDVRASHRFLRMSPRKVRLIAATVRGLSAIAAEQQLLHSVQAAGAPLLKTLRSAIANAKQNHEIAVADLTVKTIQISEGPTLKRYRPRAYGRAAMIRKRTSHVLLVLSAPDTLKTEKKAAEKTAKKEKAQEKTVVTKVKREATTGT